MEFTEDQIKSLVIAARNAFAKMKSEYDKQQPDAGPDECWSEAELLQHSLEPFSSIEHAA
jgi:hypothetical protein